MRTALLVDAGNLYYTLRCAKRGQLDYRKFVDFVLQRYGIVEASKVYVNSFDAEKARLFNVMLREMGLNVLIKPPRQAPSQHHAYTNWNVELTLDLINFGQKGFDIILCTNDLELLPAIVQCEGRIVMYGCGMSEEFDQYAHTFELPEELLRNGIASPT